LLILRMKGNMPPKDYECKLLLDCWQGRLLGHWSDSPRTRFFWYHSMTTTCRLSFRGYLNILRLFRAEDEYQMCDFCRRRFCPNAFDRHVEFCREKSSRIQEHVRNQFGLMYTKSLFNFHKCLPIRFMYNFISLSLF
jgi:hypothetical protein